MTEVFSGGAIADHHATAQHRAETAYLRTLNVVMTIPGGAGVRATPSHASLYSIDSPKNRFFYSGRIVWEAKMRAISQMTCS
jgi:hypothetical protein